MWWKWLHYKIAHVFIITSITTLVFHFICTLYFMQECNVHLTRSYTELSSTTFFYAHALRFKPRAPFLLGEVSIISKCSIKFCENKFIKIKTFFFNVNWSRRYFCRICGRDSWNYCTPSTYAMTINDAKGDTY